AEIPYQVRRPGGGGTNTGNIQRADLGCSAATIGLPGRHAHTANMLINLKDYANYIKLTDTALRSLSRAVIARNE
ncbi:MAG TPA: M42 family peptidase, partial [Anaerolineae bacterium]|nr:M42 family peptidase [Anaerolineae bacterium]